MSQAEEIETTGKDKSKRQVTVELKDYAGTDRGKVLECLKKDGLGKEAAVWQLALGWYLPFTLDPNDPRMRSVAIQCVGVLEGRIAAILRYAGLPPSTATVTPSMTSFPSVAFPENSKQSNPIPEDEDEDQEWQQRKQQRLRLDKAMLGI